MKSINSKDIGKTDEQIVIDFFEKAIRDLSKHYVGEPIDEKTYKKMVKKMWENNGITLEDPCLICGSNCEGDDCQLGVE